MSETKLGLPEGVRLVRFGVPNEDGEFVISERRIRFRTSVSGWAAIVEPEDGYAFVVEPGDPSTVYVAKRYDSKKLLAVLFEVDNGVFEQMLNRFESAPGFVRIEEYKC